MLKQYLLTLVIIFSATYAQDTTHYCNTFEETQFGNYLLQNNTWGQGEITDFSQCVYTVSDGSFGWKWDWPNVGYDVKAYPEVIFGKKPWSPGSTYNLLPILLSDIVQFSVDYEFSTSAEGVYNTAFEFWATESFLSDGNNITTEVMIWIDNNGMVPAGSPIDTVSFDGYSYILYRADWDTWTYYAFLSETSQSSGVLNVHKFISYMFDNELLNPNDYLASLEFGNEVIHGSGQTHLSKYEISLTNNTTDINSNEDLPQGFKLNQNYPNPFNPSSKIIFSIPKSSHVLLTIFDALGEEIAELINENKPAGTYEVFVDGTNLSSGTYFYSLISDNYTETKKMTLLK